MRTRYSDEEEYESGEVQQRQFLAEEHLTAIDWIIAAALAVAVFFGVTLWALPGVSPLVWDSVAMAAGLRPPADVFPGFWRGVAKGFFAFNGVAAGLTTLKVIGHVVAGMTAGAVYLFIRSAVALLVRGRLRFAVRRYLVQRIAAIVGAILFACSDPAWRAAQTCSSEGLLLLVTILAVVPFLVFMLNGTLGCAYLSMFLLGALGAETPLGVILLAGCWFMYYLALRHDALGENMPLLEPITAQTAKWMLSFLWGLGLACGFAINAWSFLRMGGGATLSTSLPLAYALRWWAMFADTAGSLGWALAFAICVAPFVIASIILPRAVDEERFLPYYQGGTFFVVGVVALSQLSLATPIWFWTWNPHTTVRSLYILQVCLLLSALVVAYFFVVLGVDACCRNHVKLASFRMADEGVVVEENTPKRGIGGYVVIVLAVIAVLAASLPGRSLSSARTLSGIVEDFVKLVVEECGEAKYLFTDGVFDSRLELEMAAKGRTLHMFSLFADDSAYQRCLRLRAAQDVEDRQVLGMGASATLRSWKRDRPQRLSESALLFGFSQWLRDGEEVPPCGGTLMRVGASKAECAKGVAAARALAERVLAVKKAKELDFSGGARLGELFMHVSWRLSQLARMRAAQADHAGDVTTAKAEGDLADRLDDRNVLLKSLVQEAERRRAILLRQVTPREGMQVALLRADFALASRYARVILESDPDDPDANFGVGMFYFQQKQWARAEESLARCLVRKSDEPAIFNNLALAQMQQGRLAEAEANARKALKLLPNSAEVKDTIAEIATAKEMAEKAEAKRKAEKKAPPPNAGKAR